MSEDEGRSEGEVVEGEVVDEPAVPPTAEQLGIELPDDPAEAVEVLLSHVAEEQAATASHLDDLKRVAADFENFRRRALRDQSETTQRAAERVATDLLPALDSFDAALAFEPSTEPEHKLLAGMRRTHEQLMTILTGHGLEVVPTVGEGFDPEVHEAVMSTEGGDGRLVVSQELRRGYRLKDRLIRPALVALEHEG
ncbi:nucleotide exchange factor GrpE [soil metagenome]